MDTDQLSLLKEMSAVVVTKDQEIKKNCSMLLKDRVSTFNTVEPAAVPHNSLKKVDPKIVLYAENELKTMKFLSKTFPKAYIIHATDNNDLKYLKESLQSGANYFIERKITQESLFNALERPTLIYLIDKKTVDAGKNFQKISFNIPGLICIADINKIYWANRNFLEFFNAKNASDFNKYPNRLKENFIFKSGAVDLSKSTNWITELKELPPEDRILTIKDLQEKERYFYVSMSDFSRQPQRTLIAFTPIPNSFVVETRRKTIDPKSHMWDKILEQLSVETNRAERHNVTYSTILMDIKDINNPRNSVNDEIFAHYIHETILNLIRPTDYCGRLGIAQFVLLATHTDENKAKTFVERILKEIKAQRESTLKKYQINFAITGYKAKDFPLKTIKRLTTALKSINPKLESNIVTA